MSALSAFYLGRLRALKKTKNRACPGEEICLTDAERGICAMKARASADEEAEDVLERICHADTANGGCELYPTKPENTPRELMPAIEEAEKLRRLRKRGGDKWLPELDELSALDFDAYDAAEEARETVENEPEEEEKKPPIGSRSSAFANYRE